MASYQEVMQDLLNKGAYPRVVSIRTDHPTNEQSEQARGAIIRDLESKGCSGPFEILTATAEGRTYVVAIDHGAPRN